MAWRQLVAKSSAKQCLPRALTDFIDVPYPNELMQCGVANHDEDDVKEVNKYGDTKSRG